MSLEISDTLLESMRDPAFYPHPVHTIQVIHTHISTVFLTGEFAYKIKKPVNFGFLDFTQLAERKHFCEEELRLNRRLAPGLYLEVLPILRMGNICHLGTTDTPEDDPHIAEYTVKMCQFNPEQQLDQLLTKHALPATCIDALASQIASFHQGIETAPTDSRFGLPEQVLRPMQQNFDLLRQHLQESDLLKQLDTLENWTQQAYSRLYTTLLQRKQDKHIRACHGDMHLGNIALVAGKITIFDGIEFNDDLRWIDTASEIAFLVMDLQDRNASEHAQRLLNIYLEISGDYDLLQVLDFYRVYRALVRAKVNALRLAQQTDPTERHTTIHHCQTYLQLAESYTHARQPALLITHGLSGSGKSRGCRQLVETLGFIQIRSDVERKRLASMAATERDTGGPDTGIYSSNMSQRTYARLATLAADILHSGYQVVVDATFLHREQRQSFQALAQQQRVAFLILHFSGSQAQLESNILRRQQANTDASDADIAVLHKQLATYKPLQADEPCVTVPTSGCLPTDTILARLQRLRSNQE
ncbi:MAG: AAA family ATPase [Candidatus Thiothrix moscowensis]|nr:AAA family ATPase [Candidatus Thiothrix moscowensis]